MKSQYFETAPVGLFHTDTTGRWTALNRAGRRLCEVDAPQDWPRVVAKASRQAVRLQWEAAVSSPGPVSVRLPLEDGRMLEVRAERLVDGTWSGAVLDITEQVRGRQADETSRLLLRAVPDLLFAMDADDCYADFRSADENKLVVPPEMLIGAHLDDFMPPPLAERLKHGRDEARRTGEVTTVTYSLATMAGVGWFEARIGALDDGGWLAIVRDITEAHHRQRALEAALEEAQRANRARNRFLANVSHELRTPLNGVLGMAQLLGRSTLDAGQRQQLELLVRSGHTLLGIIDDLLDMTRITTTDAPILVEPVELTGLLRELVAAQQISAKAKGLAVAVAVDERVWVQASDLRLKQVLGNLLHNAIKYTEVGGVTLSVRQESDDVVVQVRDTGPGVPPGDEERIFEPFHQVDTSLARRHGGAGLGLSIARDLAERMGGSLVVRNNPDGGACFELTLRAAVPGEVLSEVVSEDEPLAESLCVVVAEDTEANAVLLRLLLESCGHTVFVATNGRDAVALTEEVKPDVVLLDLHMPGMDGFETLTVLRERQPNVPVLAVTADVMPETRERCVQAGFDAFLGKPYSANELWAALRQVRHGVVG